jgi:UPF0755 protein
MILSLLKKYRVSLLLAISLLLLVPLVVLGRFLVSTPGSGRNIQILEFSKGQSLKKFATDLEERKIITNAGLFTFYARLRGDDGRVKAGYYQFSDAMTPAEVLRRMVAGEVYAMRFTVPEGYSIYQVAELLAGRRLFDKEIFLKECFSRPLLRELGINGKSVEGYLYPSTYYITPNLTAADFIRVMTKQFDKVYARDFAAQAKRTHLSQLEIITLASMIEKEAVKPEEKPIISSVFYNRLRRRMPLQSDPTSIYGVRAFAGNISRQDLTHATPFNTYLINGLPPGPIGNPGSGAIEAALNPAETCYLYFVAKGDGTHYFSSALEEHNAAVRKYLKAPANPSPRPVAEFRSKQTGLVSGR